MDNTDRHTDTQTNIHRHPHRDDTDRHTETHRPAYTDTHINENKLKKKKEQVCIWRDIYPVTLS